MCPDNLRKSVANRLEHTVVDMPPVYPSSNAILQGKEEATPACPSGNIGNYIGRRLLVGC